MNFFDFKLRLSLNKISLALLLLWPVQTRAEGRGPVTRARYLMGTLCEITAYGAKESEAITQAFEEIARLERIMSTYLPDSELSYLNKGSRNPVPVSNDLWTVLIRALKTASDSEGAFDPTYASPPSARGWSKIQLFPKARAVRLVPGAFIDLGGIGKGYALDAAAVVLRAKGIRSALLNFGGQIYALGSPPGKPAWPVDVARPECDPARPSAGLPPIYLRVANASVSTSGDCERPGHIYDPHTGKSVRKKVSVTVVAPTATDADAWDTPLYIRGLRDLPKTFRDCAIELGPDTPAIYAGDCSPYLAAPDNMEERKQQ